MVDLESVFLAKLEVLLLVERFNGEPIETVDLMGEILVLFEEDEDKAVSEFHPDLFHGLLVFAEFVGVAGLVGEFLLVVEILFFLAPDRLVKGSREDVEHLGVFFAESVEVFVLEFVDSLLAEDEIDVLFDHIGEVGDLGWKSLIGDYWVKAVFLRVDLADLTGGVLVFDRCLALAVLPLEDDLNTVYIDAAGFFELVAGAWGCFLGGFGLRGISDISADFRDMALLLGGVLVLIGDLV